MKRQIRDNVFETNSSSTHSVTVNVNWGETKSNLALSCRDFNDFIVYDDYFHEERIQVPFGEFGWKVTSYNEVWDKLTYVATMLLETYKNTLNSRYRDRIPDEIEAAWEPTDIYETNDFHELDEIVYNATGYDWHICFDEKNLIHYEKYTNKDGNVRGYFYNGDYGYIDHQSCENYYCLQDWLNDWGLPSLEFVIFNSAVTINTDNDNYY